MAKAKSQTRKTNRPSVGAIVFMVISIILILSYILTLVAKY